ncbi:MAG TPA: phytanoyl-CoA dioxygenase family protein [Abditibacteriaceae bacterium]|nr:phytanoyl-CoA dioxygenase family protein [Abditibacteriaceae bacterium]
MIEFVLKLYTFRLDLHHYLQLLLLITHKTPKPMTDIANHAYALDVSGYTRLPAQIERAELEELRQSTNRALEAARTVQHKQELTGGTEYYEAVRCLYCWGDACVRLLEHEAIHDLATLLMGQYCLWDMAAFAAQPTPATATAATTSWHRDFSGLHWGAQTLGYLWFFVCLDDFTTDNGATWIVPGSHRVDSRHQPVLNGAWTGDDFEQFPSRLQLCAAAGDILVLNPAILHSSGRNATEQPRRLINVGVSHASFRPLVDHWAIAGPTIQAQASERLSSFLGANRQPLATTWAVVPDGWQTAEA